MSHTVAYHLTPRINAKVKSTANSGGQHQRPAPHVLWRAREKMAAARRKEIEHEFMDGKLNERGFLIRFNYNLDIETRNRALLSGRTGDVYDEEHRRLERRRDELCRRKRTAGQTSGCNGLKQVAPCKVVRSRQECDDEDKLNLAFFEESTDSSCSDGTQDRGFFEISDESSASSHLFPTDASRDSVLSGESDEKDMKMPLSESFKDRAYYADEDRLNVAFFEPPPSYDFPPTSTASILAALSTPTALRSRFRLERVASDHVYDVPEMQCAPVQRLPSLFNDDEESEERIPHASLPLPTAPLRTRYAPLLESIREDAEEAFSPVDFTALASRARRVEMRTFLGRRLIRVCLRQLKDSEGRQPNGPRHSI